MTEKEIANEVEGRLIAEGINYEREHRVLGTGAVDFMLFHNGQPAAILEVKKGLSIHDEDGYRARDYAKFMEQCLSYQAATGLPVFLGPFFDATVSVISSGGVSLPASNAFHIFGGRSNIGTFSILRYHTPVALQLHMRSKLITSLDAITMVTQDGCASKSHRVLKEIA